MVLKLHAISGSLSTCTKRVVTVLHEKKVPYELIAINPMSGENRQPAHLSKQPFGQIPYIDDDGFILYESRAICRYIAAKYPDQGQALVPPLGDLKAYAQFEQAASVELCNFEPHAGAAVAEMLFKPYKGQTSDPAEFAKHIALLEHKLDGYEAILGKQKYLAGDEITLADLFHLPYGSMLPTAGSNVLESMPNVARWFKDISSRPSWLAAEQGAKSTMSYE